MAWTERGSLLECYRTAIVGRRVCLERFAAEPGLWCDGCQNAAHHAAADR